MKELLVIGIIFLSCLSGIALSEIAERIERVLMYKKITKSDILWTIVQSVCIIITFALIYQVVSRALAGGMLSAMIC